MRNINLYRKVGFALMSLLLLVVAWVTTITHANRNISNPNPLIHFAIQNNIVIMVVLIVISVMYGFLLSSMSYYELRQKKKTTRSILQTVFLFLGKEERNIIEFLVANKGTTTQAEISRLPGMSRVKAYRSLQKMQDKNLIEIVSHGKVRKVTVKENIMDALNDKA